MQRFDAFSGDYKDVLDKAVSGSGEDSRYFSGYKARYLARLLGESFSGKILDFGCGVGLLSMSIKENFLAAELHGYDLSSDSIGMVDETLAKSAVFTSNISQICEDYDLIVIANVLHHIAPSERLEAVLNLKARLAKGGRLAVFEHNPSNPLTRRLVDDCPFDEDAVLVPLKETSGYMAAVGLQLQRQDYIVFFPKPLAWFRQIEPSISWLPLGAQYVCVGEKND